MLSLKVNIANKTHHEFMLGNLLVFFAGGDVRELSKPAGEVFTLEEVGRALETHKPVLFFVTHAESSTGGLQGLEGIGPLCAR